MFHVPEEITAFSLLVQSFYSKQLAEIVNHPSYHPSQPRVRICASLCYIMLSIVAQDVILRQCASCGVEYPSTDAADVSASMATLSASEIYIG